MIVRTRAPLRIDWAGGWTDVPAFADAEGGAVVNAAISLAVHVDFLLGGGAIRLRAEDLGERVTVPNSGLIRYDGKLDLHKAALNMLPVTGGIEILSRSDAPVGSGLGGSGALDVALLAGLARCREEPYAPEELAEIAFQLETQELGLAGGRQDQYGAALGGVHHYTFGAAATAVRPVAVSEDAARDLARHTSLVYTGRSHFSSQTHERVWSRYAGGDADVGDALHALQALPEAAAAALEAGDWRALAAVVDENWRQQQRLDATISTTKSREIEQAARAAGAWGVKATGAGAGGCLVVLHAAGTRGAVAEAVAGRGGEPLAFAFQADGVRVEVEDDADDS